MSKNLEGIPQNISEQSKERLNQIEHKINVYGEKKKGSKKNRNEVQREIDKLNEEKKQIIKKEKQTTPTKKETEKIDNLKNEIANSFPEEKPKEEIVTEPAETITPKKESWIKTKISGAFKFFNKGKKEVIEKELSKNENPKIILSHTGAAPAFEYEVAKENETKKETEETKKIEEQDNSTNTENNNDGEILDWDKELIQNNETKPEQEDKEGLQKQLEQYKEGNVVKFTNEGRSYLITKSPEDKGEYFLAEGEAILEPNENESFKDSIKIELHKNGNKIDQVIVKSSKLNNFEEKNIQTESENSKITTEQPKIILSHTGAAPAFEYGKQEIKEESKVQENVTEEPEKEVKTENKEEPKNVEPAKNKTEISNDSIGSLIMPEKRGLFSRISAGGKEIMGKMYEKISNVIPVNRIVAKMGIAYNQFWIDKKENKSIELKSEIDSLNLKQENISIAKSSLLSSIEELKGQNIPGQESLQKRLKDLEKEETKLANEKDRLQTRIEKRENSVKLYTNKRDQIANELISFYEKKLSPIESHLEALKGYGNRVDLISLATKARYEEEQDRLNKILERRTLIEEKLMTAGLSNREINKTVKYLDEEIDRTNKRLEKERKEVESKRNIINKKIAKEDARANPYRDRRSEFIRVKENRPQKIELDERVTPENKNIIETTDSNKRKEAPKTEPVNTNTSFESLYTTVETKPKMVELLLNYNKYLESKSAALNLRIDKTDILKATKMTENNLVSLQMFKEIIKKYYQVNRIPENNYIELLTNLGK